MPATAFDQQHLQAGDGHTLYVAQYGKPDGPAAVVLHGGPGPGADPRSPGGRGFGPALHPGHAQPGGESKMRKEWGMRARFWGGGHSARGP